MGMRAQSHPPMAWTPVDEYRKTIEVEVDRRLKTIEHGVPLRSTQAPQSLSLSLSLAGTIVVHQQRGQALDARVVIALVRHLTRRALVSRVISPQSM